jgi:Flp pilus assembly protein TadB
MPTTEDILRKYGSKIESQMKSYGGNSGGNSNNGFSKSYKDFKNSMVHEPTKYERWCKSLGSVVKMKVSDKDRDKIQRGIDIAHLDVSVSEVASLSVVLLLLGIFSTVMLFAAIYLLTSEFPVMFLFLGLLFSLFLFYFSYKAPERAAMKWRLIASSQMVPAILYIVIYMKHTSNFEKAIAFAAEHLDNPLAADFKKIFWNVEVGKYSTIKESVDAYLETWRDYSIEFIESFHLIESSLYESSESRRVLVLEKALQVILDGVYDKMLKYTHSVKAPLTNLYMLGIVLPTLALAILPLASTMLGGAIKAYHLFVLFNLLVPFMVIYLTGGIMMQRPGGYGETSLLERNPLYPSYKSNKPYFKAALVSFPLLLIGLIPALFRFTNFPLWFNLQRDYTWSSIGFSLLGDNGIFGIYEAAGGNLVGPFGVLSLVLSLFVPLALALFFIIAYKEKTKLLIKSREDYKNVEEEFTSSLFQLGNRMGDGMPAEIAFAKVAQSTKGTATEGFFKIVNENIQQLGMSVENALFNSKRGAVIFYPSQLVATSMKILVESVKKGLQVAAKSLMSISEYVKNIKKIDVRLNDLLADITSDMKSNMVFLAPLLSGIIVGLAGMITTILGGLSKSLGSGDLTSSAGTFGGGLSLVDSLFKLDAMMPTYWLQLAVGLYLIEIIFILTSTLVTIKSGKDDLQTTAETGKNLKAGITLYLIVSLLSIVGLSLLGAVVLNGL